MSSASGNAKLKLPLHLKNEDFYFPIVAEADNEYDEEYDPDQVEHYNRRYTFQNISIHGDHVFLMADGHAGHEAPAFFIDRISVHIIDILNLKPWNFGDQDSNSVLTRQIALVFSNLDNEYTRIKTLEYQSWNRNGADPSTRPCDDGCTMILNIISTRTGYVLNCNVGDSRTVLSKRERTEYCDYDKRQDQDTDDDDTFSNEYNDNDYQDDEMEVNEDCTSPHNESGNTDHNESGNTESQWDTIFASVDHDMTNPHKVYSIHKNGGKFLDSTGSVFLHPRVEVPYKRIINGYPELSSSRLYRPMSDVVGAVGCSQRRTLNLSGTLGDLLFKIHPPILFSTPDFTFIKLQPRMEHLLVVATDGIWDHLSSSNFMLQNQMVMKKVTELLESGHTPTEYLDSDIYLSSSHGSSTTASSETTISSTPPPSPSKRWRGKHTTTVTPQLLKDVCRKLVNREPEIDRDGLNPLYSRNLERYDDATIMLIHIEAME